MSVLISGVLMNPAGVPVSGAEVTFSALTNGPSVLNGFSASVMTDQDGNYSIPLEICEYAISIQSDGYNSVYGSVSINEKSTPATINELLKLAAMEQTVTPAIIVYFREIQTDVAAKLATMQALSDNATTAASTAIAAKNEAVQYAQALSAAVAQAQQASTSATASANTATAAKNSAETAAGNAQATFAGAMKKSANGADIADAAQFRANLGLREAMIRGEFGVGGYAIALPDKTNVLNYFAGLQGNGFYRCYNPVGMPEPSVAAVFIFEFSAWNENHSTLTARSLGQDISYELQNTYQDGAWKGWSIVWNNNNLPNPMIKGEFGVGGIIDLRNSQLIGPPSAIYGKGTIFGFCSGAQVGLPEYVYLTLMLNGSWDNVTGSTGISRVAIVSGTVLVQQALADDTWSDWCKSWNNINLSPVTANTAQTIIGNKTFKGDSPVQLEAVGAGRALFLPFFDSGKVIRKGWLGRGSSDVDTMQFTNDVTSANLQLLATGDVVLNPKAGQIVRVGANQIVDAGLAQTIGGAKTFSQKIKILRDYPAFVLETTRVPENTVGRVLALEYEGLNNAVFLRRVSQENSIGQQRVVLPMSGNGTILVAGVNAVADASGFYKTASPVINIYADGSFTTTHEAIGVNVERLSEGVYKITGCQGMHSDAAWNGIDGGVSNPKCRNDKALLWNNYEVAEDGSVTVYTFHRVHPDAMPFAQNRLTLDKQPFDAKKGHKLEETWPDQSPIDVPRGAFIQVRVNMPERIAPYHAISHSNVYCNTIFLA
ncbi:hypothetical protein GMW39_07855 [Pectobacterium parmentieri]|uniref:phage tail fiber protein n=1 Tax=Pectobacterium parmentieri TaxID=1905730 RepID=UPI001373B8AA|nr:prophage tail fiber N-terminal domain-containing protein [Pectobacterium parmentieri]QHQ15795.1 hypothetical protein GMW39_07855 [Pectobacterium parmentieri]